MTKIAVYLDDEDLALLDTARGKETRSSYIRRILGAEWRRHPIYRERPVVACQRARD